MAPTRTRTQDIIRTLIQETTRTLTRDTIRTHAYTSRRLAACLLSQLTKTPSSV